MRKIRIKCAFCKGQGKDPFEVLSKDSLCQVCAGEGEVEVEEPIVECLYCQGTGIYPYTRLTCTVCCGKGVVFIKGETERCLKCQGIGREKESGLSCSRCGGKGVVSKK